MVDGIKKINANQNPLQKGNVQNERALAIFLAADQSKDGKMSPDEALAFGFTTLGDKSLTQQQFIEKYNLFLDNTSTIENMLKPFENVLNSDINDSFVFDVKLSDEQKSELLKRLEMFNAYFKVLNADEKEELMQIKSNMFCFNWFRKDYPVTDDYELPDDMKSNPPKTLKDLPDYKYVQIKNFLNVELKKIISDLKKGKMNNISNAMLSKYIKLASVNELESDGKIGGFRQGALSDCWLLSNLLNYVSSPEGEKNIQERIRKNADGSYTVIFNNPFEQTKKEVYNVTKEELANYFKINRNLTKDNCEKAPRMFSSGDIDVRILEIATNKLLEKYLDDSHIYKENTILLEWGSYIKEALFHKALGYTERMKHYTIENDKASENYKKVISTEYDIVLDKNGKAQLTNRKTLVMPYESLYDLVKGCNFKESDITCSAGLGRKEKELVDNIFMQSNHAYNFAKITNKGFIVNNPLYAGFPHFIKKALLNGDFFSQVEYFPKDKFIRVSELEV